MQMTGGRDSDETNPQMENGEKLMRWPLHPPFEKPVESERDLIEDIDEVTLQIGPHYYWIRRIQDILELCRAAVRTEAPILYEVLQHDRLGISDDDLEDAVRLAGGELNTNRSLRISNHIQRKLQSLYVP